MPTTTAAEVEPVTITLPCETDQCYRCKGTVRSMTGDRPCEHGCHALDDLAVEAILEADHYAEV
jgi:hypothetical protein